MNTWPTLTLGEICKPKQWPILAKKDLEVRGHPAYGAGGLIGYTNQKSHDGNVVLIGCRGTCGNVMLVSGPLYASGNAMALDALSDRVNPRYLAIALERRGLQDVITGSSQPQITRTNLVKVRIPVPPLLVQNRIVAALESARFTLEATEREISGLTSLVQYAVLERSRHRTKFVPLPELLTRPLRNGLSPSSKGRYPGTVLTLSAITGGHFRESAQKSGFFDSPPLDKARVQEGALLICRGNGNRKLVGVGALAAPSAPTYAFPDTMIEARFDAQQIRSELIPHLWNSHAVQHQIQSRAKTTNGTYKISQADLQDVQFIIPSEDVQAELVDVVQRGDRAHRRMQQRLILAQQLYDSVQYRAFRDEL
ncbi:restriction endonuclease subunit S [Kocuria sp. M1R5S2]|uniref:restriction endonuclease subunit S n=1 Tax=Kocuria rhizosphaerae TaxID=3376285 RepID=UPI0037A96E5D